MPSSPRPPRRNSYSSLKKGTNACGRAGWSGVAACSTLCCSLCSGIGPPSGKRSGPLSIHISGTRGARLSTWRAGSDHPVDQTLAALEVAEVGQEVANEVLELVVPPAGGVGGDEAVG